MTLDFFERFQQNVTRRSDHVGLQAIGETGRESFTYAQIAGEVAKIGLFLQQSGVRPGDAVGILMENHPRWGIAFLAVQSAGAVVVPFDILHHEKTLAELIQHSECKFLISSEKFLPKFEEIQRLLPQPLPALLRGQAVAGYRHWETVLAQISPNGAFPLVRRELDDPLVIIYTSGTTGNPKGVVLTQRNVYRTVVELLKIIETTPDDHILSVLPLYHVLALMANFIIPLYMGARVTYVDVLEAQRILRSFQDEAITIFVCVPQFYYLVHRRILQEIEKQSAIRKALFRILFAVSRFFNNHLGWNPGRILFASLHRKFGPRFRLFGVGGARFASEVAESFRDLGFRLVQAYGMTETAAVSTVTPPTSRGVGSVGKALPHVQIHIEQPDENGIGEVLIRGENIMKGYWKNPEETAAVLRNGWLRSGDLGYLTPQGFLYITGRKKDVIVLSSGKNIFPEEIEHYYQSHCPFIKEMCVLGVADPSSPEEREKLHAVVVPDFDYLKSKQVVNAYDAIRYEIENLSQRLPAYKRIRSLQLRTDPLPRTTTRKIKRFELQKELAERPTGAAEARYTQDSTPETPTEAKIFELIRQMKKAPVVHRDMNLELDLGFDSLERVEFLSNLEQVFQIRVADERAAEILSVKDLLTAVEEQLSLETAEARDPQLSWQAILQEPLEAEMDRKVHKILRRKPLVEVLFYLLLRLDYFLCKLFFRLKVTGKRHLPRRYPFLICPNHLSFLDAFAVCGMLPYRVVKRLFFLGYSEYFSGPVMSLLAKLIKLIPVDADRNLRQALRLAAEGLHQNLILCVFPEGERSIDGILKPFRKGPAILATELQVPVVPVGIVGTYQAWPRGSNKIRLHPLQVHCGPPLQPPFSRESYPDLNQRLFQAVKALTERKGID